MWDKKRSLKRSFCVLLNFNSDYLFVFTKDFLKKTEEATL